MCTVGSIQLRQMGRKQVGVFITHSLQYLLISQTPFQTSQVLKVNKIILVKKLKGLV